MPGCVPTSCHLELFVWHELELQKVSPLFSSEGVFLLLCAIDFDWAFMWSHSFRFVPAGQLLSCTAPFDVQLVRPKSDMESVQGAAPRMPKSVLQPIVCVPQRVR